MWALFQLTVFMMTGFAIIYSEGTNNGVAIGLAAFLVSALATHFLSMAIDSARSRRREK